MIASFLCVCVCVCVCVCARVSESNTAGHHQKYEHISESSSLYAEILFSI